MCYVSKLRFFSMNARYTYFTNGKCVATVWQMCGKCVASGAMQEMQGKPWFGSLGGNIAKHMYR